VSAPATARALEPRNSTEEAILDAARRAISEEGFERMTVDGVARRAYVSRTAFYFYFENKRALVDRLIQRTFSEIYASAAPYLEGSGEPRREIYTALARVVGTVNRNADLLLLAARLHGEEDRLPPEWEPYIRRLVVAAERRIRRDQERGAAPADVSPRIAAQALSAMVERHITIQVVRGGGSATESIRVLAELWWRAVYSWPAGRGADGGAPSA
jgi:AcrR family transcriptional regulator